MEICKVQSHIAEEDAAIYLHWLVNTESDELANKVRELVIKGQLTAEYPPLLPGALAQCVLDGTIISANLKESIHSQIGADVLVDFLCRKYTWSQSAFNGIDWDAHAQVIQKIPLTKQVTFFKLLHGWLPTQKRRFREGYHTTPQCLLCTDMDDWTHIYCCQNEDMRVRRHREHSKFIQRIRSITNKQVSDAIEVATRQLGGSSLQIYSTEFVTSTHISHAITAQSDIGWEHFLLGRLAREWREIGPREDQQMEPLEWASKIASYTIDYSLALWRNRNQQIHGTDGGISRAEENRTVEMIRLIFEQIGPNIRLSHKWLFQKRLEDKLTEPYHVQIAWIDSVRRLYPEQFQTLRDTVMRVRFKYADIERHKAPQLGSMG